MSIDLNKLNSAEWLNVGIVELKHEYLRMPVVDDWELQDDQILRLADMIRAERVLNQR